MPRPTLLLSILLLVGCVTTSLGSRYRPLWTDPAADEDYFRGEAQPGGATTVADASPTGLGRAARNLDPERWSHLMDGKRTFQRIWRAGAAPDPGTGLGPLYNGNSCSECHFRDGRGGRPAERDPDVRLLTRLAVAADGSGIASPDPTYGSQLSVQAVVGLPTEGVLAVTYRPKPVLLSDGSVIELRQPEYHLRALNWGTVHRRTVFSPRMPGALVGMGLLEAIAADDVLSHADPDDRDGDGISGRANWVPDVRSGGRALGRFGWKAGQPRVEQQIATAFRDDMGLTSWLRPETACTEAQRECRERDRPGEVSAHELERITTYVRLLGVPARRELTNHAVRRGRDLFMTAGCASCHTPRYVTAPQAVFAELAAQLIFPYTDLLLHDMGPGLADDVAEFEAQGAEWRTPPLWGLGLLQIIHGRLRLLHDGRARSVEEAILWHDGEALQAHRNYVALPRDEREALVRFVESL